MTSFVNSIACFSFYLNPAAFYTPVPKNSLWLFFHHHCTFLIILPLVELPLLPPISQLLVSQASTSGLPFPPLCTPSWWTDKPQILNFFQLAQLWPQVHFCNKTRLSTCEKAMFEILDLNIFKVSVLVIINGLDKGLCSLKLTFTSNSTLLQAFLRNECKFLEVYKVKAYSQRFKS